MQIKVGLLLFCICFVSGGATCARHRPHSEIPLPPVVFRETPTLQQLIDHTNRSISIERIESNNLVIKSPGLTGQLSGSLQWERPDNFNLQAYMVSSAMTVLAAGSNSEEFWLRTQLPPPPTLYFARRDDFESQLGPRHILPVSPLWLKEALGIVEFDPSFEHEGPHVRSDNKLEVKSLIPSPRGPYVRVVVFAPHTLAIEETRLYDQSMKMVARAQLSDHEYFSVAQSSLPHNVIVELIPDSGETLSFTIDVGFYLLNQASNPKTTAFTMPDATGLSQVDLVQYNLHAQGGQPVGAVPPVYRSSNAAAYSSALEGYRR